MQCVDPETETGKRKDGPLYAPPISSKAKLSQIRLRFEKRASQQLGRGPAMSVK